MRLIDWSRDQANSPDDKAFANRAFWDQVFFIRDRLPWMLLLPEQAVTHSPEDRDTIYNMIHVIGTHRSKSVNFPVYRIDPGWITIYLRDNLYGWAGRVESSVDLPEPILSEGAYLTAEGMEKIMQPSWSPDNCRNFGFTTQDDYTLFTLLHEYRRLHLQRTP